ncbi:MAG: ABC transporter permease [Armatimonadetes bacterium]|nr:ABC transporter permease [Armatimonadota bacterium]
MLGILLVLGFNLLLTPDFFSIGIQDGRLFGSLIDILNRAVPVLLLAAGMTLVIATGGVDLSVGAVMAIGGAVAACVIARPEGSLITSLHLPQTMPAAVLAGLAAAVLCGLWNALLVGRFKIQPIVATLLLMVAGRGAAQLLTSGQIINFDNPSLIALGSGASLLVPNPVWIALGFVGLVILLVRRTALGLMVEATGSNETAARIAGVSTRQIIGFAYVACALGAGIAGVVAAADIKAADANASGLYLELDAILSVAIGGTSLAGGRFNLAGSILGALLMQALTTTINTRGVSADLTYVVKALVVVAVCLLQSPELRGKLKGARA